MDAKQFTQEQIIGLLKEVEDGETVTVVCRRHGVSHALYYKWRTQYGGMEAEEILRLRQLEVENELLKKLLGEAHLNIEKLLDRLTTLQTLSGTKNDSSESP